MAEFKKYKLGDIADIRTSNVDKKITLNQKTVKLCNFVDVYYNWAITKSNYDSFMTATASDEEISKFSLKKGQVAFTKDSETRDDIGIPAYIAEDFKDVVLGYHTALATPDENIVTGEYLNAFMHSSYIQKYFELNATGSGMRYTLSQQTLHDIPILAPDLDAQHKIGSLLSKIDRKISINREINRNLEELAKLIYDYWFVQFDFPNEEGKPYKSSGGKMVWNEILNRKIPDGWEVKLLKDIIEIKRGITITEKQTTSGTIKVVAAGLTYSYLHGESNRTPNCITVSGSGANAGFVNFWREPIFASDCSTIQFDNDIDTILCYHTLKKQEKRFYQISHKSAQPHILPSDIGEIPMIIPSNSIKERISQFFIKTNKQIAENTKELEHLSSLRDNLLPLLMNGQVTLNSCLSAD